LSSDDLLKPNASSKTRRLRVNRRHGVLALLTVAVLAFAVVGVNSANAVSVAEVQRKVNKLNEQAEQAAEDYNTAGEELKSANVRLKAAQEKSKRLEASVRVARAQVGRLAAESYRRGQLSTLDLVLGDDPDAALAQAGLLPTLGERQAAAMRRLKLDQAKLESAEADIKAQQAKAKATNDRMKKNRTVVDQRLHAAQVELSKLRQSDRVEISRFSGGSDVPASGASVSACKSYASNAPSSAARAAINFACSQIGDPYQWAATGMSQWDCSGLTMKAFAAGGVTLPHSSKQQAGYGSAVGVGSLQAGDLIFFGSPIHHVAIYLGNGLMVHAPQTNERVKVASVWQTPSAARRF
jgi:peptidoglycan DL-endopeptidase CwlO